jgi:rRNA-processing protein FCF1
MEVMCDTSFMMVLGSIPLRNIESIESSLGSLHFTVPNKVADELRHLESHSGPKRSRMARTALSLIGSKFNLISLPHSKYADEAIIKYSSSHSCAVATIDRELKTRLIKNKVLVITLRDNKLIIGNPKE